MLSAAVLAALACVATGTFSGEFASIFNTWNPSEDVRLVDDFTHLSQIFHPQAHEEEHSRKKRNGDETARFGVGKPITHACERPGYTGQYCEFPICEVFNPIINPEQFLRDEGYVIDLTDLGNCTRRQKIIVDETMYDIRIEVQSLENVSPQLSIFDELGYIGKPDQIVKEDDRFIASFKSLPPGAYTVQPSASSLNSRCILTTTAQTIMTISGGFQTEDRDRSDFPNDNAGAHQFNSILLTLYGTRAPAALKTVSVVGPENYVLRPRELDKRYGCQYEFYFDSLFCYSKGSYALVAEGVDFNGNLFRRVAAFDCIYKPGPTTPTAVPSTPPPTNPTSCSNGGVLLDSEGKTACICQDHWTGYDCSKALCINGGTLLKGKCFCPIGFEGVHCEQVQCESNSNHGFGVDRPTLVFVVRARVAMNPIMTQVQKAIDKVIASLQFDPTYLTRFHLVVFNDHEITVSESYTTLKWFDSDLFHTTNSRDSDGGCYDLVMEALATAFTDTSLTQGSTVYVITDGFADDYEKYAESILQMNSFWRATINFIYVQPEAEAQCTSDPSDPGFRSFDEVANRFGGMAWNIQNRNNVYNVLYGHMNSILYKSQLMLTLDRDECNNGLAKVIQLERSTESLVFVTRGRDFNLELTAPDGSRVVTIVVTREGIFSVRRWSTPLAGAYVIKATTASPSASCNLRAYQASPHYLSSTTPTEVFWGITSDVDTDAMRNQPVVGMNNHPVFHIEDFGDDYDHALAFLNMYAVRNGVEQEVYASNGLYRGGCTFQFYFPSFRCRGNENIHYEFNLRNDEGFYTQRAGVMTCFNCIPSPTTPSDCQNGGVRLNNETCLCQSHYEGDHCKTLICENGGTPVFGNCQCSAGWTGPFCAYAQCPEAGPISSYGYHADMAFLVEVSPTGVKQINQLIDMLPEIIRDVSSQHAEWIDRLVLIGYNYEGVIGMVDTPISNPQKLLDTLDQWANSNPFRFMCHVEIWKALDTLLNGRKDGNTKRSLPERSIINIFESAIPLESVEDFNTLIGSISEELLEKRVITNVFQAKNWNTENGGECGGKDSEFANLERVARRGDGTIYTLGNADLGKAIRMIPTLFSSSIVYKYHSADCTVKKNVYFPVDAYTQTITAIILGQDASVGLRYRDPGWQYPLFPDDGRVEILNDGRNLVVEFRNPCENDWSPISQYCAYSNYNLEMNFQSANVLCASMGGFMVDDLSNDKNYWIGSTLNSKKGWLGLTFVYGQWVFQQDGGAQMPVPKNGHKWAGVDIPDGTTGTCAYYYMALWHPSPCDPEYTVICQKHMFDQNNQPSNLGDDNLGAGKYYLEVQTDPKATVKGCDVEIRVQSDLSIEFGFADGLRMDTPRPIANVDSNENRLISSISIGKAKTQNSKLTDVMLRTYEIFSTLLEAATNSYRFGCSYDFVSQPLSCDLTNGGDFSVVMIGEDDTGNTFQRYSTSLCSKWYICENDGVYSNGQCLCADYFTGDQCETPICQNGGEFSFSGGNCTCPQGYGGAACQFVQCDIKYEPNLMNENKALVLVIEKSVNTAEALNNLAQYINGIYVQMNERHYDWVDKFMILTFRLDGTIEPLNLVYTIDQVEQILSQLSDEAKLLPGACQMPIWKALDHLFDYDVYTPFLAGSEVLIISSASPSDADLAAIHSTMEKFDIQTPIVDFLHIETDQCTLEDWAKGMGDFADFLSTTSGIVFRVTPTSVGPSLMEFLPTRYAPQRLSYSEPFNCKDDEMYIHIDTGMLYVFVLIDGKGASIKVEAPKEYNAQQYRMWTADEQTLWGLLPSYPGIYKITVSSDSSACFPEIYGSGGSVVTDKSHAAQVFSGFIQNYNFLDTPKPYAVFGEVNFPVFFIYEVEGQHQPTESLYMTRITRKSADGKNEESYTSDVDLRDGCSYTHVGKAFTCIADNDVITLSISGNDASNQPFTRQSTTYCKTDGSKTIKNFANTTNLRN